MTLASDALRDQLRGDVHDVFRRWHKEGAERNQLDYLVSFQRARQKGGNAKQAIDHLLTTALDALEKAFPQDAKLLRKRFLDGQTVRDVARQFNIADSTLHKLQSTAIDRLVDILLAMEEAGGSNREALLDERLGYPPYRDLVGVQDSLRQIREVLVSPEAPWLVSLEGIGGIGKTSLADALVRDIVRHGDIADFGWVSAQQSILTARVEIQAVETPALSVEALVEALARQVIGDDVAAGFRTPAERLDALQQRFKQEPHLIVVDNLETLQDIEHLLPALRRMMAPTKFLLTSRESLYAEPDVYRFAISELDEASALRLIRQEARLRNLPHLLEGSDAELLPIYTTVGGNPLALRLVVGQSHVHGLNVILDDLSAARGQKVETLYTYIYRRAWDHLDELSRLAFLAMPLVSDRGGDLEYLTEVSGLDAADLRDALERLVTLNLVDVKGGLAERRYTIHNLTRTFLQEQVARWLPASPL